MKLVILGLLIAKITSSIYRLFDPNKLKTSWHDTSANYNTNDVMSVVADLRYINESESVFEMKNKKRGCRR